MSPNRARLVLLLVPALWGLVFVGVDRILRYLDPFELVSIRFAMVAVAFGLMMVFQPALRPRLTREQWKLVWLAGLFGVPLSQLGVVTAQQYLDPALASLLITTSPAVSAILAPYFLPEHVTRRQALGFAIAFAGAAVVIVGGAGGASFSPSDILGASIGIITPIAWAVYTILLKRLQGGDPLATVGIGLVVGTAFLIPWMPSAFAAARHIDAATWAWLGYLAVVGTFFTYVLWFRALVVLDASQVSAYLYLVPVFALLWSLLILGQAPPAIGLVGGVLVFAGVALTQTASPRTMPLEPP